METQTYTVEVDYTDRARLADGSYRTFRARVTVAGTSPDDARCAAIQMATAIRYDHDVMPLASRILV